MLSHLGFSAWISCEDEPLPELEVTAASNRVTCWIPSKEGKNFVIHWVDEGSKVDTAAYITLDGLVVPGRFLFGHGYACRGGVRASISSERPFIFSKVHEGSEKSQPHIEYEGKLGMIMLRIKRIKRAGGKKHDPIQTIPDQIHAKRKSGEHCVGFGSEVLSVVQEPTTWAVEPYDRTKPGSYVTFVFRYRSPEFLIAQGIMTPSIDATPPTPALSIASTPPSTDPSPTGRSTKRKRWSTSAGSQISICSEPALPDYSRHVERYPGEGLFWFQNDQPTDIAEHLRKKSRIE